MIEVTGYVTLLLSTQYPTATISRHHWSCWTRNGAALRFHCCTLEEVSSSRSNAFPVSFQPFFVTLSQYPLSSSLPLISFIAQGSSDFRHCCSTSYPSVISRFFFVPHIVHERSRGSLLFYFCYFIAIGMTPFDLSFSRNIILSSLFSYYIFVRYLCIDRSFFRSFPLFPLFDRFIEGKYARITRKYRYYRKYRIYTPFFAKNKIGRDERLNFYSR